MAEYTGTKQSKIFYKVAAGSGEPLDVDGIPTAISGKKQAIRILAGWSNPDPEAYEVEGTFTLSQAVNGQDSAITDPESCPPGEEAPWILDSGTWDMGASWINDEIWTTT